MSSRLYPTLQELSGARFTEITHARDVIDLDFLRLAREEDLALPSSGDPERDKFHGAEVFDPQPGLHENVAYVDYAALYPNIMRTCNISPETCVGTPEDLEDSDYIESDCVWSYVDPRPVKRLTSDELYSDFTDGEYKVEDESADSSSARNTDWANNPYKIVYDPNANQIKWRDDWESIQENLVRCYFLDPEQYGLGFLCSRGDDYIKWNKQYEGTLYDATKMQRNAIWGVSGDTGFRLFYWLCAESITMAARLVIDYAADATLLGVAYEHGNDSPYIAIGDTDGFGVSMPEGGTRGHVLNTIEPVVEYLNNEGIDHFMEITFGTEEHYMDAEVESYSPSMFIPQDDKHGGGVKKTHAKWMTLEDGEEKDEIEIKGFEYVRSDQADVTEDVQKFVLETILRNDPGTAKEEIYPYLRDLKTRFQNRDISLGQIGKRKGMSKSCHEYGSANRRPQPAYRGAKYAHEYIDGEDFSGGGKPFEFRVSDVGCTKPQCGEHPDIYDADTAEDGDPVDCIAIEDPRNLPGCATVDYDVHWEKTVEQPLRQIMLAMGWSIDDALHAHEQSDFSEFSPENSDTRSAASSKPHEVADFM